MKGTSRSREEDGNKKLDRKEVEKVIGRLKDGKATEGVFRMKCGSTGERRFGMFEFGMWNCRRIWRGEG